MMANLSNDEADILEAYSQLSSKAKNEFIFIKAVLKQQQKNSKHYERIKGNLG